MHNLEWVSDQLARLDGVEFFLSIAGEDLHAYPSRKNHFLLGKTRSMVEDVAALREREDIRRILDVGIFKGGSTALHAKFFKPEKLVAIEYVATPVDALTDLIRDHGFEGRVRPYYGVNQADVGVMGRILASEFPERNLDLIVDDASHLYFETRTTFNLTLPYLRPDGLYIIEDWGWAHWSGDVWQKGQAFPLVFPAMSNLLIELFMLCASRPDLIRNIVIAPATIVLRRGATPLEPGGFEIGNSYLCRNRWFKPVL